MNTEDIYTDKAICTNCHSKDKHHSICDICNAGSNFFPMTFPVYNIVLMFLSLYEGLQIAKSNDGSDQNIMVMQEGFMEALKFVLEPSGNMNTNVNDFANIVVESHLSYTETEDLENAYPNLRCYDVETIEEIDYRRQAGSIRAHQVVCCNCRYKSRFNTEFCWSCNAGSNFESGIRSIHTIQEMLMNINTFIDQNLNIEKSRNTLLKRGLAEGLKWVLKPSTIEEELMWI